MNKKSKQETNEQEIQPGPEGPPGSGGASPARSPVAGTEGSYERYDRDPFSFRDFIKGILLLVFFHMFLAFVPSSVPFIGLLQLIYLLPALIVFRKRTGFVFGLLAAATVTLLINAFAFGYVMYKLG